MPATIYTLKVSSQDLSWMPETKTLVGEASSVFRGETDTPTTVIVESARTGKSRNFVLAEVQTNNEGEIEAWKYRGVDLTLKIFND